MFKQKKLSLGARFGLQVASFILGIFLFFSVVGTALIANVQAVISEDGIQGIVQTIMSAPARVRPSAPISVSGDGGLRIAPTTRTYQLPRLDEPGDVAASLTDQVIGMFYEALGEQFQEVLPVTQEEFTQLINDSTVKDYIADKTTSLITDYFNDEITTTFEAEEVVQLIEENSELIESITGQPIPDDIAQQVGQIFDNNEIVEVLEAEGLAGFMKLTAGDSEATPEGMPLPGASSDTPDLRYFYKLLRNEIAPTRNLILGIVSCLILMAAIILINCRQLGKGLRRAGYPLILAGAGYFALNASINSLGSLLNALAGGDAALAQIMALIPKLLNYFLSQAAAINTAIFCIGIALFVAGIVVPIVLKARSKAVKAPVEAVEEPVAIVEEAPVEALPVAEEAEEVAEETPAEAAEEEAAPVGE